MGIFLVPYTSGTGFIVSHLERNREKSPVVVMLASSPRLKRSELLIAFHKFMTQRCLNLLDINLGFLLILT